MHITHKALNNTCNTKRNFFSDTHETFYWRALYCTQHKKGTVLKFNNCTNLEVRKEEIGIVNDLVASDSLDFYSKC